MATSDPLVTPVVVVGGGPVGMLFALRLAQLGTPCVLAEQNEHTITYPKMDVTNIRSMEILRFMGLADEYRKRGLAPELSDWVTPFVTGMGNKQHHLFTWPLDGNKTWRRRIVSTNDGTQPIEPPLRSSQIIFEAMLKEKCLETPLITSRFGWKFESCDEDDTGVTSNFVSVGGQKHSVRSQYLVGSDGGRSTVRKHIGIQSTGYNFPAKLFMTYIRSDELAERVHFGNYWHIVTPKGFLVDTNAGNLFASHHIFSEEDNVDNLDPAEVAQANLGGTGEPWKFKIDEVLAHSVWQPRFRCANALSTPSGKIFLVGDAGESAPNMPKISKQQNTNDDDSLAHAVPPHGGHSLNTGILGMWNLSWKLAAVLNGHGGSALLESYDKEMRPIAMEIIEAVGGHISRQMSYSDIIANTLEVVDQETAEGEAVRARVGATIRDIGNHGRFYGRELDQRFCSGVIVRDSDDSKEPNWDPREYTPSTWPGARAPHVWLKSGPTPIFDCYGLWWTLAAFRKADEDRHDVLDAFQQTSKELRIPLKVVELIDEDHAKKLWGKDLVLVRPDGHVAWRSDHTPTAAEIAEVMSIVSGRTHLN